MNLEQLIFYDANAGGGDPPPKDPPPKDPPPKDPPPPEDPPKGPVPYDRFSEVVDERNKLQEEIDQIRTDEKKRKEDELKEQNQWKQLAEQKDQELQEERLRITRLEVAAEKGLPAALASRLQGSTKEEMIADADTLLQSVKLKTPGAPPPGGGNRQTPPDLSNMSVEDIIKTDASKLMKKAE